MYIGFITASLGDMPLEEKAQFAHDTGFKGIELCCWPRENDRDYSSSDIDVANFGEAEANKVNELMGRLGLTISSLAYYDNNLAADPEKRAFINNHTKLVIDAAALLGVELVGTFTGRDTTRDIKSNFDELERVFTGLVSYAESKGVKLMIENCQMPDWHGDGLPGTISYSPELWEEMFRRVPGRNFGLNYDPSHLHAMCIDYIAAIDGFEDRIFHVHAKDAEVFPELLTKRYGVYDRQIDGGVNRGYWRYRMPSLGQVDWPKLLEKIRSIGYDGVLSIEHEDLMYEGSAERVKEGLRIGLDYLKGLV